MTEYSQPPIDPSELLADPTAQFDLWYQHAIQIGELEPTAMTLATVNKHYDISARMVLLKSFDQKGFVFFSNYNSRKAQAIKEIPQGALVFWWPISQRQVRITGTIALLDPQASDQYFASRNRQSQITSIISEQSTVIADREALLARYEQAEKANENKLIQRPDFWGGYIVQPQTFEFWQGGPYRLSDRFLYTKKDQGWKIEQLSP
jgi:pyridoxamine 5'-phosphate oxidase